MTPEEIEEDNKQFFDYLEKHREEVLKFCFLYLSDAKFRSLEAAITNKDRSEVHALLNDAWWNAPDTPSIRTPEFFRVCDLCDGGYAS